MIICLRFANGGYKKNKKQTKVTPKIHQNIKLNITEQNKLLKCTKENVHKEDVNSCCYGTCCHQ